MRQRANGQAGKWTGSHQQDDTLLMRHHKSSRQETVKGAQVQRNTSLLGSGLHILVCLDVSQLTG